MSNLADAIKKLSPSFRDFLIVYWNKNFRIPVRMLNGVFLGEGWTDVGHKAVCFLPTASAGF